MLLTLLLGCASSGPQRVPETPSAACVSSNPQSLGFDAPIARGQVGHPIWGAQPLEEEIALCRARQSRGCDPLGFLSQAAALCLAQLSIPGLAPTHAELRYWSEDEFRGMAWVFSDQGEAALTVVVLGALDGAIWAKSEMRGL